MRPDQVGGLLLKCRAIHAGEIGPPPRGMRFVKLGVENHHELSLRNLVLARAIAQQRNAAGGLADGAGPGGFVRDSLPDLLFQEGQYVENEGCEFAASVGRS